MEEFLELHEDRLLWICSLDEELRDLAFYTQSIKERAARASRARSEDIHGIPQHGLLADQPTSGETPTAEDGVEEGGVSDTSSGMDMGASNSDIDSGSSDDMDENDG